MEALNLYLKKSTPTPNKSLCCTDENIVLSESLLVYVCKECGTVDNETPNNLDFYDKHKNPKIVKTYIPYSHKYRHLHRINKWGNYDYHEVQLDKLMKEIEVKLVNYKRDEISFTKGLFSIMYKDLSIRAKIKDSLIAYCLFTALLTKNRKADIDEILKVLNISIKNYIDLNKKLTKDKLIYLEEMNIYLKLIDYKIEKNDFILKYSKFIETNNRKFNNKSILLGIIYYELNKNEKFDKKDFYTKFSISKTSIKNVCVFIKENDIY